VNNFQKICCRNNSELFCSSLRIRANALIGNFYRSQRRQRRRIFPLKNFMPPFVPIWFSPITMGAALDTPVFSARGTSKAPEAVLILNHTAKRVALGWQPVSDPSGTIQFAIQFARLTPWGGGVSSQPSGVRVDRDRGCRFPTNRAILIYIYHETPVSTVKNPAQTAARLFKSQLLQERSRHSQQSPPGRPQTPHSGLIRSWPARLPSAGVFPVPAA